MISVLIHDFSITVYVIALEEAIKKDVFRVEKYFRTQLVRHSQFGSPIIPEVRNLG